MVKHKINNSISETDGFVLPSLIDLIVATLND